LSLKFTFVCPLALHLCPFTG